MDVAEYTGSRVGVVSRLQGVDPLPEDHPGMPTGLEAFVVDPTDLFRRPAAVAVLNTETETLQEEGQQLRQVFKPRKLMP